MIQLIYGQDQAVANWVQARLPEIRNGFGAYSAIGVMDDDTSIAGVVYHDYRRHDIQLSMAADSPSWCNRRTLRALLGYPFNQLMVARITACTGKHNKRLRSMVERLGFQLEGRIRKGFDGTRDMLVYGMIRAEAERWISQGVGDGQRQPSATASA